MAIEFVVSDMTCNHCVKAITEAVTEVAPGVQVAVDLQAHRVVIEGVADAAVLRAAIEDAGYTVAGA